MLEPQHQAVAIEAHRTDADDTEQVPGRDQGGQSCRGVGAGIEVGQEVGLVRREWIGVGESQVVAAEAGGRVVLVEGAVNGAEPPGARGSVGGEEPRSVSRARTR